MPWLIGIAAIAAFGYVTDKVGEGINDAGSGALKITLAAGAAYLIYKKVK